MWWPVRLLLFFWFRIDISSSIGALLHLSARLKRKKRNWAIFPERGRPLSGQGSSLLFLVNCSLYDELSCFLGSTRPSTLRPKQELKNDVSFDIRREVFDLPALRFQTCRQKMEIVNQDLDGSLSLSLSTEIPIYMERDPSMNRSRLSSIRIDMSL